MYTQNQCENELVSLHPAQEEVYFDQMVNSDSAHYNIGGYFKIKGKLNVELFKQAIKITVNSVDIFGIRFDFTDGHLLQIFDGLSNRNDNLIYFDFSKEKDSNSIASRWINQYLSIPFDLSEKYLYENTLIKIGECEYWWVNKAHHILTDGVGYTNYGITVSKVYNALISSEPLDRLDNLPSYKQSINKAVEYLKSNKYQEDKVFWVDQFQKKSDLLLSKRYFFGVAKCNHYRVELSTEQRVQLYQLCEEFNVSLLQITLVALSIYFAKTNTNDELVFGVPVHNRRNKDERLTVGMMAGVTPFKIKTSCNESLLNFIKRISQALKRNYRHQRYPISHLKRELKQTLGISNDLFDVIINYEAFNLDLQFGDLKSSFVHLSSEDEVTPLQVRWCDYGDSQPLQLKLSFRTDYFSKAEAVLLADRIIYILLNLTQYQHEPISTIPILTPKETQKLLVDWNQTAAPYPVEQCIHELFEVQADKNPNAIAVVFEEQQLTYGELNQRSNQLAYYLIEQGVKPGTLVGFCIERCLDMIIGLLGILKAGGAYVPLDPSYPVERLSYMIEDSGIKLMVTQYALRDLIPKVANMTPIYLDTKVGLQLLSKYPKSNIAKEVLHFNSKSLAYVIYTSGSTGKPKGIEIRHKSTAALISWSNAIYGSKSIEVFIASTSINFDLSIFEIFVSLSFGKKILLVTNALTIKNCINNQTTLLNTVPSIAKALLDERAIPSSVKIINLAGEPLTKSLVNRLYQETSVEKVFNLYGPSEDTTYSTFIEIIEGSSQEPTIGKPISNTTAYVLSPEQTLLPIGVPGELYIGGAGLARGYLNRPELTAEKFIAHPFSDNPNARLYRTGDLVRWLPDGNLEFIGRIDHQVKIRGFRIELGEIEAVLVQQPSVQETVVVAREDQAGDKRLVAYIVATGDEQTENALLDNLKNTLKQQLPDYMVPSGWVVLDKLPLTPNGKIDRKALPAPEYRHMVDEFIAPSTPTEIELVVIWQALLQINQPISCHANFFELGGHSLLAVRLVSQIRDAFSFEITVKALFNIPLLSDIATLIDQHKNHHSLGALTIPAITPRNPLETELPLSYAQQRLWFIDQLEENSAHYNIPGALLLEGYLNFCALNQALTTIIERHESLRTRFITIDGQAYQQVMPLPIDWTIEVIDLHTLEGDALQASIQKHQLAEAIKPFDLSQDCLLRGQLLKLADQQALLLLTMHHIAADGWSIGVLINELNTLYHAYCQGHANPLPPLTIQYADYALWQRGYLQGEVLAQQVEYWREQLQGLPEVHQLPLDHPRPSMQTFEGATYQHVIDKTVSDAFNRYCVSQGATLFMGLHAAFSILLSRYSGETDIVIGTPIANREQSEVASLIGFFVNTLVMRADLSANPTFKSLLQECKQTALDAYAHQQVPFEQLVDVLQPSRHLSHHPLFQVMLALQNNQQHSLNLPELTVSVQTPEFTIAKFDLTLNVSEQTEGLILDWEYNTQLFETATIERMAGHFNQLLIGTVAKPDQPVNTLTLLTEKETQQLLVDWNQTNAPCPTNHCIHELFEAQAEKNPNAIAVVFEEQQLTYGELNQRSNQLAHYLIEQGVKPDTLVGLCIERSLEMIIGLLGILKAGGAYVPLDPSYPVERLSYMIEDSGIKLMVTQYALRDLIPKVANMTPIYLDTKVGLQLLSKYPKSNIAKEVLHLNSKSLAYVIYTSGSTGKPKGVLIPHTAVTRLVINNDYVPLNEKTVIGQCATITFDAATFEVWGALLNGGRLALYPQPILDLNQFNDFINHHEINTMWLTSGLFDHFVTDAPRTSSLKYILTGGDVVSPHSVAKLYAACPDLTVINGYGPTENTTFTCCFNISPNRTKNQPIPIGCPISNTTAYVFSPEQTLLPIGIPGELYVGGAGLARGYLNRPELTAEKFIAHPFSDDPNARLYRTGDLVRWLPDGNLEFIGRIDHQVKIRGFRIELGEIEAVLAQQPSVQETVVVAREDQLGDKRLVAYIVATDDEQTESALRSELKHTLKQQLPDYMVPSVWVVLDKLPLTPNGKIDRKALPEPDYTPQADYVVPTSMIESQLCEIWQAVLGIARVSTQANFFTVGGDSIKAIQVASRAQRAGLALTTRQLFTYQTIAELALHVTTVIDTKIPQVAVDGEQTLLPIQQHFLTTQLTDAHHFNQALSIQLPPNTTQTALQHALLAIVARHDVLRLAFEQHASVWQANYHTLDLQVITDTLHCLSVTSMTDDANRRRIRDHANQLQASFDLSQPPLSRWLWIVDEATANSELIWIMHHLIVDGVSWRVLVQDLQHAIEQFNGTASVKLAPKTSSYQRWARYLKTYSESPACQQTVGYWQQVVSQPFESLPAMPLMSTDSFNQQRTARHVLPLNETLTQQLLQQANGCYHTQINDLLLTALLLAVTEWSGGDSLRVDLEGHGREALCDDINLSETVGWFTSVYPVYLHKATTVAGTGHIGEHIKVVKEQLRQIPNKGIDYGILQRFQPGTLADHRPSEIVFNYLGQFNQTMSEGDIQLLGTTTGDSVGGQLQREHVLGFNCLVIEGQWQLALDYHQGQFSAAHITQLADKYHRYLTAIIQHCISATGGYTPSDFPLVQLTQPELDQLQQVYPTLEDLYPSTPMQQGMLFHSELNSDTGVYMTQLGVQLHQLDSQRFEQCWQQLIARHAVLRTAFVPVEGQTLQLVQTQAHASWQTLDWQHLNEAEQQSHVQALLKVVHKVDPQQAPLMDFTLAQTGPADYWFIWRHHHALLDGWCLPILFKELFTLYQQGSHPQSDSLSPIAPYRAYIAWLQQQSSEHAAAYWRHYLAGFTTPTVLPLAHLLPTTAEEQAQQETGLTLSTTLTEQLQQLAQSQQVTLNSVVQAAWGLLLSRYSGEQDVVFGSTRSGRPDELPDVEHMVGLFINSVPIRLQLTDNPSLADCLQQLHQVQVSHDQYSYAPLVDIQRWSEVGSGYGLFESLIVFENYPLDESLNQQQSDLSGQFIIGQVIAGEQTNYPLSLLVLPGKQLHFKLLYQPLRYTEDTMSRLLGHLQQLLLAMTQAAATAAVTQLNLLTEKETQQLLVDWNQTNAPYPTNHCIHELFEAQAEKNPNAIAVVFEEQQLTYGELNQRSNQLAHYLIEQGVKPDTLVGLCLERSLEMVIGLLGILKAGGAYVPLDPSAPQARLQAILDDCQPAFVLTQIQLTELLSCNASQLICLDTDWHIIENHLTHQPYVLCNPDNLAYVIYTSGSTGKPKGVLQQHKTVVNIVHQQALSGQLTHAMNTLQFTTMTFDVALQEIVTSWFTGSRLVLVNNDARLNISKLVDVLIHHGIERLFIVPALLNVLTDYVIRYDVHLTNLQEIITAGEALQITGSLSQFLQDHPCCSLWNHYGPSETHVVTVEQVKTCSIGDYPPIGKPLKNHQCYVVNQANQLQPIGVPGELLVSGVGLARGYLNRSALTAEKFIANPFSDDPNARLYRTGDLVRWLPDGNLEFIGRIDHQVKIRGFRIELGEIEAVLVQQPSVQETVVVVQEDRAGDKRIVAYIVATDDEQTGNVLLDELKNTLKQQLPDYMVPSGWVVLDKLPLTPNGKINRKALPAPEYIHMADKFIAPSTPTEIELVVIWQDLLKIDQSISINANFFDLGGHSLLVMQLVATINDNLDTQIAVRDIFAYGNLKELAAFIDQQRADNRVREWIPLVRLSVEGATTPTLPKLYCVPGAGGFSIAYQALSDKLSKHAQVLVFEAKGLDGIEHPHDDWELLIDCYLKAIIAEQTKGPYFLLGHSFGGRVVFELARKLEALGHEVKVIILDTVLSNSILANEIITMSDMSVAQKVLQVVDEFTREMPQPVNNESLEPKEQLKQLMVTGGLLPANGNHQLLDGFLQVYAAQEALFEQYVPSGKLQGKLYFLYGAESFIANKITLARLSYNQYCAQKVDEYKVEGGHVSMLRPKNVHSIVSVIVSILQVSKEQTKTKEDEMIY
ncbi:amino acid adenylation domain-containing protein [Zooshikella sp. RANM57]|uniref:amino acid adenylation domain-containing protein n=1 Tax=Zooshikella sp. RANM57 TaxID=3425863 RepID=UPI003D6F3B16